MTHIHLPLRRRGARSASGLLPILLLAAALPLAAQERPLVVTGGHWLDVRSGEMRPNAGIVAVGGRLLAVGGIDAVLDTAGATRLELAADEYVLPGLVDLHAHYNVQFLGLPRREELVATPVLWLANGVTSTFPAGEYDPEGMRDLRLRIQAGEVPGPRLFNSGPYYGRTRPGWTKLSRDSLFAEVDLWAARGVRGFKAKGADPETLRWLIERAHHHGLTVTGHLDSGFRGSVNPRDAILMGIDRIEHFLGGDAFPATRSAYASFPAFRPATPEFDRITRLFIERGVTFDPTITAYAYYGVEGKSHPALEFWTDESRFLTPEVRAWVRGGGPDFEVASFDEILKVKCPLVAAFHEAGGTLGLATDHPSWGVWLPGFVAHRELHALALCGIPEADVLRIATLNGAEALGMGDLLGSLEAGKLADFFVVRGNPLDRITNTRNVVRVVKSGTVYDPAALFASIEGRMGVPAAARRAGMQRDRAAESPLRGRTIVVDAGHGGTAATDSYRVGPTGEREEWIDLRVAHRLRDLLEERGARVIMTREADVDVGLRDRAELALQADADAFLSIHHNATADPDVNFPIVYYHGHASRNRAGVDLARHVAKRLDEALFGGRAEPVVVSDHVIFAGSGTAVLRHSYGIPGVIGEASFFTNPAEERRLRDPAYNRREAEAYVRALEDFFSAAVPPVVTGVGFEALEPFRAAQEAERMSATALLWREDYDQARRLVDGPAPDPARAFELATRSVRSFPDSPVAREAHLLRARILEAWGRADEAAETRRRVREFYPEVTPAPM